MSEMPMPSSIGDEDFDMSQLSEEDLQKLISLGMIDENMAENARQMAMQEGLRYGAAPEGRDSGRVYTAANPLEHVGSLLQKYNANKEMKNLKTERGVMQGQQTAGKGMFWDLLRGKRKSKPTIAEQDFSEILPPGM
jgi:hypothetical protein